MNKTTKFITSVLGVTLAIGGLQHGFFEILQGFEPTPSMFIDSIGPDHKRWEYGGDGAFTIVPNFMLTGIAAMLTSIIIMIWSVYHIDRKNGAGIFLLLFILLTLFGGGLGHIPFFLLTWAYARRINKPLLFWERRFSGKYGQVMAAAWKPLLLITSLFFVIGLEISVTGYVPGTSDPDTIMSVCWSFLLASLVLINFTFLCGYAKDARPERVGI